MIWEFVRVRVSMVYSACISLQLCQFGCKRGIHIVFPYHERKGVYRREKYGETLGISLPHNTCHSLLHNVLYNSVYNHLHAFVYFVCLPFSLAGNEGYASDEK